MTLFDVTAKLGSVRKEIAMESKCQNNRGGKPNVSVS